MAVFYKQIASSFRRLYLKHLDASKSGGSSYDVDAAAFFAVVTTLSASQKNAVNAFIVGLKADNLWTKFDRLYINVGTTITDYAVCIKSLTSRTAVNSPTWTATGTSYNGTNSYFRSDIQVDQSTQLTSTNASAGMIWDPNNPPFANSSILMGTQQVNQYLAIEFSSAQ